MTDTPGSVIISPKPIIGITLGDFNGIGPEITLKSLLSPQVKNACIPVVIGPQEIYSFYSGTLNLPVILEEITHPNFSLSSKNNSIINIKEKKKIQITPGRFSRQSGTLAGVSISIAASLCVQGDLDAMVTAPVSKEALQSAGYRFPGQTEMLAKYSRSQRVVMMFVSGTTRIALATIHIPVGRVARLLTKKLLSTNLTTIISSLENDFGIPSPRIAILGLNPHAGENGTIGREEQTIILPVLRRLQKKGCRVDGPFPADGFWGRDRYNEYDVTLAMYHDQGLIPFKMRFFSTGVNYSAGLSIIRSSPDHGTAFDIAGKGQADARSMIQAILLAAQIAKRRKNL